MTKKSASSLLSNASSVLEMDLEGPMLNFVLQSWPSWISTQNKSFTHLFKVIAI
jgi:hypothetical protein